MIGKAALRGIELIGAYAQVDHHAVDFLDAALKQQLLHIMEIALDRGKIARAIQARRRCGERIVIAIDAIEMPRAIQPTQDFRAVAAAAERTVDIHAAFTDIQHVDRLLKHDAQMLELLALLSRHLAAHLLGFFIK